MLQFQRLSLLAILFAGLLLLVMPKAPAIASSIPKIGDAVEKTMISKSLKNKTGLKSTATPWSGACSPNTVSQSGGACKPPDFALTLMVYLKVSNLQASTSVLSKYKTSLAENYPGTWSIYLGGVCTLYYSTPNCQLADYFCVKCLKSTTNFPNFPSLTEQRENLNQIISVQQQSWYPNTNYYIGLEFDQGAINQIVNGNDNDMNHAVEAVVQELFPNSSKLSPLKAAGIFLDTEGNGIVSAKGAEFANQLSNTMPNDMSLNIFAGKAGQTDPKGVPSGYAEKYDWSFWPAVNRSSKTDCYPEGESSGPCHMGVFIPSVYDSGALTYKFNGRAGMPLITTETTYNVGIVDFPYQLRRISLFGYQVSQANYMAPISVPGKSGKTISPPFGYYKLGLGASATAGNSPIYATFDKDKATPLLNTPAYWGADGNNGLAMPFINENCGGKYAKIDGCNSYRQMMYVPPPIPAPKPPLPPQTFKMTDLMNSYVCAQLNAVTYIYSNRNKELIDTVPTSFCNIVDRYSNGEIYTPFFYDSSGDLPTRGKNQVYPWAQAGYGAMKGVALYQIADTKSSLLDTCYQDCKNNNYQNCYPPGKFKVTGTCLLMPSFWSIWNSGNNSTWDMIMGWATKNHSAPVYYIPTILPSKSEGETN